MGLELTKPKNSYDYIEKVDAIRRNDSRTIQQIYVDVFPKVKFYILQNNGDEDQAKDIFQEAFIALWKNIKTNNYNRYKTENVEAYLYAIAKNKWIDHLRSAVYRKKMPLDALKNSAAGFYEMDEAVEIEPHTRSTMAFKAVNTLGKSCQKLLKMFYFEKKSMVEISKILKISEPSARNKKYRCMKQLREYINAFNNTNE